MPARTWLLAAALAAPAPFVPALPALAALAAPAAVAAAAAPGLAERAAAGQAQAQHDLAIRQLCARPPQPKTAALWLGKAAEQGHTAAQGVLGWMYMAGHGVPQDDQRAARWLRPAAEAGNTAAQNNLGVLYAVGSGVPHDHGQARRWFAAAADKGAVEAERNIRELDKRGSLSGARAQAGSLRFLAAACGRPAQT